MAVSVQNIANFCKYRVIILVFLEKCQRFAENWRKSKKNCDHSIDD
jgi:hypothetical protein